MMAPTGNNSIARKRSTDAKGSGFSSASNTSLGSFKRNGDGKTLHDVRVSSRKPLSRNASLTIGDAEQINGRSGRQSSFAQDTYVRTCSHALEDALLSFHDLKLSQGKEKDALSNYLPLVTIGDSIVCLARDERLIEEVKRRKVLKRMRDAESFSKDHYKYSLFAGEDPMEEELPQHLELTPQEHIEIARNSITGNELGIHNMRSLVSKRLNRDYSKGNCNRMEKQKSQRYDSESSTILLYADRSPIFIPKLDFSSLPNFRKPRLYNQQMVKGHLKKSHQSKSNKPKGLIGFLSLKFGF